MNRALITVTFALALISYACAGILFFLEVARREPKLAGRSSAPPSRGSRLAPICLGAGAVGHAAYVTLASFVAHVCPIHSVHFSLSVASLLATAVYLAARRRFRIEALGLFVTPLGFVFLLSTFFMGNPAPGPRLGSLFIVLHILSNLSGAALFLLAGGAAALYLIQENRLKQRRHTARMGSLPPLEVLDRAVYRFLVAGFPLLTVGIVTGTFWARHLETGTPDEIMRVVLGYATWLLIAAVLLMRAAAGWHGRRAAYGTLLGFACVTAVLVIYLVRPAYVPGNIGTGG
jgi:ABC-type uncharacterized transport system permease subunit